MFSLTIQDNHLNCRKQLRESSQLPEVLQKVRVFTCVVYTAKKASQIDRLSFFLIFAKDTCEIQQWE